MAPPRRTNEEGRTAFGRAVAADVEVLKELHAHTGRHKHLFPTIRNPRPCTTTTTMNRALERMGLCGKEGIGFSAHGLRAAASTILHEAGYRSDVIERQLSHAERNKVLAADDYAEYPPEHKKMTQDWSDMIDAIASRTPQ